MALILLIGLGALLGWLAAIIVGSGSDRGLTVNILTGIGGAIIAGLIINPLIGEGSILVDGYTAKELLVAIIGSMMLLASVNLLRLSVLR